MPNYTYTGTVVIGADDYYQVGSYTSTIIAQKNNITLVDYYATAELTTSSIPDDATIQSATFYWYNDKYNLSKGINYQQNIYTVSGVDLCLLYTYNSAVAPSIGWNSVELNAGCLANINKQGKTVIRFTVNDPGGSYYRSWEIRAFDYDGVGVYAPYMVIEYSSPSTVGFKRIYIRGN